MTLPPLPEPSIDTAIVLPENLPKRLRGRFYTQHDMEVYALAVLEAAAKVCDNASEDVTGANPYAAHVALRCADAIRKMKEKP